MNHEDSLDIDENQSLNQNETQVDEPKIQRDFLDTHKRPYNIRKIKLKQSNEINDRSKFDEAS